MAKVQIIAIRNPYPGFCSYSNADYSLYSKSEDPYNQDRWVYYLDRYAIVCTAYRAVIDVDGYLPHINWVRVSSLPAPLCLTGRNCIIEEPFEESGRVASEETLLMVKFSPQERAVMIQVGSLEPRAEVFVSPHTDLILGAGGDPLELREIHFRNVAGLPD